MESFKSIIVHVLSELFIVTSPPKKRNSCVTVVPTALSRTPGSGLRTSACLSLSLCCLSGSLPSQLWSGLQFYLPSNGFWSVLFYQAADEQEVWTDSEWGVSWSRMTVGNVFAFPSTTCMTTLKYSAAQTMYKTTIINHSDFAQFFNFAKTVDGECNARWCHL